MKRSFARLSAFACALASLGGLCASACADSGADPASPPPIDTGDAGTFPPVNGSDAAEPVPEASIDAGPRTCSYDGFCPTSLPAAQTIVGIWGDGTGVAWAVSTEGNVLRWDGAQWAVHASDRGMLATVWGSGPTDVWIGGERGIQHGTGASSAALTFTTIELPAPSQIASIWGLSANDIWAVGSGADPETGMPVGMALHLTGKGWAPMGILLDATAYSHVWGSAGSGVWIAGQHPMLDMPWISEVVISRKVDGEDFTAIALPVDPEIPPMNAALRFLRGAAASDTSVWLHGETLEATAWRGTSSDNGKTFTFSTEPKGYDTTPPVNTSFGTAANDVWTAGDYGQVRHWNGTKWAGTAVTTTNLPLTNPFYAVWARGSSEVWLAGKDIALRFDPAQKKDGGVQ